MASTGMGAASLLVIIAVLQQLLLFRDAHCQGNSAGAISSQHPVLQPQPGGGGNATAPTSSQTQLGSGGNATAPTSPQPQQPAGGGANNATAPAASQPKLPMYGVTEGSLKPQECSGHCSARCSATQYKKPCLFFCNKCCAVCLCVPPGTYGNKQFCPCYNNWKTKRGGPKCP